MPLSKKQIEIEKAKFENWYMPSHGFYRCFIRCDKSPDYFYTDVRLSFESWLACRENIEIELPDHYLDGLCESIEKDLLVYKLESQGFKVK